MPEDEDFRQSLIYLMREMNSVSFEISEIQEYASLFGMPELAKEMKEALDIAFDLNADLEKAMKNSEFLREVNIHYRSTVTLGNKLAKLSEYANVFGMPVLSEQTYQLTERLAEARGRVGPMMEERMNKAGMDWRGNIR